MERSRDLTKAQGGTRHDPEDPDAAALPLPIWTATSGAIWIECDTGGRKVNSFMQFPQAKLPLKRLLVLPGVGVGAERTAVTLIPSLPR